MGWSGNSKILDHLGFSRHMKTRLYVKLILRLIIQDISKAYLIIVLLHIERKNGSRVFASSLMETHDYSKKSCTMVIQYMT